MTTAHPVELALDGQVSVFGEVTDIPGARGTVLLLHDRDSDLDSARPFVHSLHALTLNTFLLDMPGHGVSGGDWDAHATYAVRAALEQCALRGLPVGVLAIGESGSVLFGLHPAPVAVAALVAPRLGPAQIAAAEAWRVVPLITMGDPCDPVASDSMEAIARWVRAWSLRLNVHYLDQPTHEGAPWSAQMTHSSAAFIAEQLAYVSLRRDGSRTPTTEPSWGDTSV